MKKLYSLTKAIVFIALFSTFQSKAQFMCTDIVPDSVVSIAAGATLQLTYDLDVNNDATPDFRFNSVQSGNFGFIIIQATQIGTNNCVLGDGSNNALALTAGSSIAPTSTVWVQMNGSNQSMSTMFGGPATGNFPGAGDRYVGLKFSVGANTYYGWVRFNVDAAVNSYTVKDYGYNATPNGSITAGQACAPPAFSPSFTIASPICAGKSVTVTANTGTNAVSGYTWAVSPSGPVIGAANSSVSSISFPNAGTFSVTLTATSGSTTANATNTILVNPLPTLSIAISPTNTLWYPVFCPGTTETLSANGASSYTWSTGSNNATIVVNNTLTTGMISFTVSGTSAAGCTNSAVASQSVMVCTEGIQQLPADKQSFSVYPNPANEKLVISIETKQPVNAVIELLDILGKQLIKQEKNFNADTKTHELRLNDIAPGVYFVRITSSDKVSQIVRLIKE